MGCNVPGWDQNYLNASHSTLFEIAIIAGGRALELMFPEASAEIWAVVSILSAVGALLVWFWPWPFSRSDRKKEIETPKVIPTKYGKRGDEEGLFIRNASNDPVLEVIAEPFNMGHLTVSWKGPEVAVLEAGQECFFYPETKGTPYNGPLTHASSGFFVLLRNWQYAINGLEAEVEGIIRYKGAKSTPCKTQYRIGIDVLNRDSGLVVRVVHER